LRFLPFTRGMPLQSPDIQNSVRLPNTPRGMLKAMMKYQRLSLKLLSVDISAATIFAVPPPKIAPIKRRMPRWTPYCVA